MERRCGSYTRMAAASISWVRFRDGSVGDGNRSRRETSAWRYLRAKRVPHLPNHIFQAKLCRHVKMSKGDNITRLEGSRRVAASLKLFFLHVFLWGTSVQYCLEPKVWQQDHIYTLKLIVSRVYWQQNEDTFILLHIRVFLASPPLALTTWF